MRITLSGAILLAIVFTTSAAWAQEPHTSLQGFGGIGVNSVNTLHPTFGGAIVGDLTPNIQLLGEVGRLGDVLPSRTQTLIGLTPVDLSVSWYRGALERLPHRGSIGYSLKRGVLYGLGFIWKRSAF